MTPNQFANVIDEIMRNKPDWVQLRQIVKALKPKIVYEDIDYAD